MTGWQLNILTLTLCLLALDFSAGQPMITTPPDNTDALQGTNVTLTCGVSDLTNGQYVAWYTGGGSQISNNDTVVLTEGRPNGQSYEVDVVPAADNETLFNLILRNIQPSESGTFSCQIYEERGDGTPMQLAIRAIRLSVEFFPSDENPMCMTAGNFTASEGDDIDLVCESDRGAPPIDITWKRGNDPISGLVPEIEGARVSLSYTFEAKRTDQDTLFKCRITNLVDFPKKQGVCISGPLNVLYPPDDISITEAPEQAPEGLFTAFQCNAGGNPPPTYSWSLNTSLSNSSYNITDNGQLLVQLETLVCNTTDIIATCEASNSQGTFTTNMTLCKVPTCSPNNTAFNALEGESLTITCTVDESVDELIWDQYDLNSSSNITLDSTMSMSSLQYQLNVERAQAYSLYVCNAIDKSPNTTVPSPLFIGTCLSGPLLDVFFPPENVTITPTTQTEDGVDYETYWCSADGNPMEITYNWIINPQLNSSMFEITDMNQNLKTKGNISCEMEDIRATCKATNNVGTGESEIILCRVPSCTASPSPSPIEGDKETLICQHDVSPVDITWNQEDTIATEEQSVTGLNHTFAAHRNDSTINYVCSASSTLQPTYTGICTLPLLGVQYPPDGITVQPVSKSTYQCLAVGEPEVSYVWTFSKPLSSIRHYSTSNRNSLLEILDISDCDADIIATCVASNNLDVVQTEITIKCEAPTVKPATTPNGPFNINPGPFKFTPLWIAIISLAGLVILVIIISLIVCAVRLCTLKSVNVPKENDYETDFVTPTRLSMELTEDNEIEMKQNNKPEPPIAEPPTDNRVSTASTLSNQMVTTSLEQIQEGDQKEATLVGVDNPSYSTFGISDPKSDSAEKKPDLLNYLTRPDSAEVDVTAGNTSAQEASTESEKLNIAEEAKPDESSPEEGDKKDETSPETMTSTAGEEPKIDSNTEPKVDSEAPKVDSDAEPKVDSNAEPTVDSNADPKTDSDPPKVDSDTELKVDAESSDLPKVDSNTEPKVDTDITDDMFDQVLDDINGML